MTNATELAWTETLTPHIVTTQSHTKTLKDIQQDIESTIDKAISFLPHNIEADSLYMLFEWLSATSTLNIVITDSTKSHDAPITTRCICKGIQKKGSLKSDDNDINTDQIEMIKLGIKDYLTTCAGFMQFSLVAAFHHGDRSTSELL